MKKMFMICNAHIDPVWQWEWEEGVGAAISTFRVAAELCKKHDGFIFNHNEAILYKWIEEYDSALFKTIQELVYQGKWHIMGGWYLQPDCNLPNGESFLRQITAGLSYFKEKFGVRPTIAVNFDPFGHTKGLVQILEKSGYKGYIICRPTDRDLQRFNWDGFVGSRIPVLRLPAYNSPLGKVDLKIKSHIEELEKNEDIGVMLWGVGNHGGGPSRQDMMILDGLIEENVYSVDLIHADPEAFFEAVQDAIPSYPVVDRSLQHVNIGCYTSQIQIKQKHRQLENELSMAEKIAVHAVLNGLMEYPYDELKDATEDLMFAQFHDILPGSSIQPVEDAGIRLLEHGIEIASRIKGKVFFKLSAGQDKALNGMFPLLVYNPLPYKTTQIIESEFMLADQNYNIEFSNPIVYQGGKRLKCQPEKELSNIPLDWRKRVVFLAELEPMCMNRFDIGIEVLPEKPRTCLKSESGYFVLETTFYLVKLNITTGLLDGFRVDGTDYIKEGAGKILAIKDQNDSWGYEIERFDQVIGAFQLADARTAADICGQEIPEIEPVRIIEDGEVRTVIEAIFVYNRSHAVIRYFFPKNSSEIKISICTFFVEKDILLKFSVPTTFREPKYLGKTVFGIDDLLTNGNEVVAQDFVIATNGSEALSIINSGTYGSSCEDGEMRLSLLRSSAYCSLLLDGRERLPRDRFSARMDQGERHFDFYINASGLDDRMKKIEYESCCVGEKPTSVCFFPSETGEKPFPLCIIDNRAVRLSSFKMAIDKNGYILRLFNSDIKNQTANIKIPVMQKDFSVTLSSFEVKTFRIIGKKIKECSICEDL